MKRGKVHRTHTSLAVSHQGVLFGSEAQGKENDEYPNNSVSSARMLENLKTALFFSRLQSEMKERWNG